MKIVVGYDGSPSSKEALNDLKRAGLPDRAEAVVLNAVLEMGLYGYGSLEMLRGYSPPTEQLSEAIKEMQETAVSSAKTIADSGVLKLKTMFPQWSVRAETGVVASPAWALIHKAEEWKADLIVVGAHGHSELNRFIGSVSQLVLIHAPCSVRVGRQPVIKEENSPLKILIGVDGSAGAEKAANAIAERTWPASTQVRVLAVIHHRPILKVAHLVPPDVRAVPVVTGLERESVNQMTESAAHLFQGKVSDAKAFVREGDPKKILVEEAENWKADCLFVGARGLSSIKRFLLGSVSIAVAARAHGSVEVVR